MILSIIEKISRVGFLGNNTSCDFDKEHTTEVRIVLCNVWLFHKTLENKKEKIHDYNFTRQ